MDHYVSVVIDYLRADRSLFLNMECCIQLHEAENPDNSGPHWYCNVVATDFRSKSVFLCEISYSQNLSVLSKRLKAWNENWNGVCEALRRDSSLPKEWPIRPWLFVPEHLLPLLLKRLKAIDEGHPLAFIPRITPLDMVQPWLYRSWNRKGEAQKPAAIPEAMRD